MPFHIPRYLAQRLQSPIPQLHTRKLDHSWIEPQRRPHIILDLRRGVISHHEIVALTVCCLMLSRAFWEAEDAPVVDAADCAAAAEDEGASCSCDSIGGVRSWRCGI